MFILSYFGIFRQALTLNGEAGNDTISLHTGNRDNVIKYASGDGKDIVSGFNSSDTLYITKGNYSVKTKENDVIVTVGKGSITLSEMAGVKISIKDSKGKVTTKAYGVSTSDLLAENNFMTADNLSEITKNDLTPSALEKVETSDISILDGKTSLTSGIDKG